MTPSDTSPPDDKKKTGARHSSWNDEPYRLLVDSVRDYAIFLLDPAGQVATWNPGAERINGYKADEIVGRHFSLFYPRSAIERGWPERELDTARRLGHFEDEGWRVRKDGATFWANVIIAPVRDAQGRLLGYSKIVRDLSERRENEERLRQSEERFRLLVETVQDYAIFLLDPEGRVASWNAGAQRIKGYTAQEIIGRSFTTFYPEEALDRNWPAIELEHAKRLGRFEDEGWRLRKDGSRFWANVIITALRDADGKLRGFAKITRDLTERRAQEERLRQSEERFRLLLEGLEDYAICMLDPEGRVVSWNAGARKIMGYSAEEIVGHVYDRFFRADERAAGRASDTLEQANVHRRSEEEGWLERKDGSRFWAHLSLNGLHGEDGTLRGYAMLVRDLSERKRMESLEERGRHLTEFLAMLAHELRNPLAPIRNAAAIMGATKDLPSQVSWSREVIERQTAQLTRLVEDLLDVSRITRGKLRLQSAPMEVDVAVQRAVEASRPLIDARRHQLHVDVPGGMAVHGDMTRLTQVFLNILNNAAKYTPEGGAIDVSGAAEGDDVVVRIRDNGVGISPALLERVFDLFAQGERTLDRSEGGLGIGLTLARRIVALHGGNIVARSEGVGRGAEFEVRLPRLKVRATAGDAPNRAPRRAVDGQRRAILVVDDNVDSANSMAILLRMGGHDVDVAHDGPSALDHVSARRPDIVLLDIGLPGMSGYQVAEQLRARTGAAPMRIYAMTGYGQKQDRQRSLESGFDGHLVKPVMPDELFRLIEGAGPPSGH
ncbi:MAG: PAS domain S-box protein [Betaproteobacteria bacterium]